MINTDREIVDKVKYHLTMLNSMEDLDGKMSDCDKSVQRLLRNIMGIK